MTTQAIAVQFHDHSLTAAIVDSIPHVALKPICDNIGIAWNGQFERVKRHPVLSSVVRMTRMVAEDGKAYEMLTMPLNFINGWLFGVDTNRVKNGTREKLIEYQRECFDVLANHFMPQLQYGLKQLPEPKTKKALPGGLSLEMQDAVKALVKQRVEDLPKEKQGGAAIKCWSAIKQKYGKPYKEVEPENFTGIVSLLSRLPLEGELLPAPDNVLPVNLNMLDGIKEIAFKFDANGLSSGRWCMWQSDGKFTIQVMDQDEFITTSSKLPKYIADSMGGNVNHRDLPSIIKAAAERLERLQPSR